MLTLIVGGSASGKSAFAENYAMEAGENRIYIATMQPMDNECLARIEKHLWDARTEKFSDSGMLYRFKTGARSERQRRFAGMYEQPDCE